MTTTDPFTEAARAEGLRLWPGTDFGHLPARFAFLDGAEWARTHLAAHVPQVTIVQEDGQPATCEVRQGGALIFSGRDHSADVRVAAQEPAEDDIPESVANLIRDLIDSDDCWFDHGGGCQAHGYLSLTPEQECPHSEAKRLLAARAARRDEEKR